MTDQRKHYAERDIMAMDRAGNYYCRHVSAMTREGLHSKSDIAAELGFRDQRIDALLSLNAELLEALEYALPYLEACVPNPRNGINPDCSVDVNCVDRASAAIAKARSQS